MISNLISPQVIDKDIDWNEISQEIIVFSLKSIFENDNIKDDIFTINSDNVHQRFFNKITKEEKDDFDEKYGYLILKIIEIITNNNKSNNKIRRIVPSNSKSSKLNKEKELMEELSNYINKYLPDILHQGIEDQLIQDTKEDKYYYFSQNINQSELSKYALKSIPYEDEVLYSILSSQKNINSKIYNKNNKNEFLKNIIKKDSFY